MFLPLFWFSQKLFKIILQTNPNLAAYYINRNITIEDSNRFNESRNIKTTYYVNNFNVTRLNVEQLMYDLIQEIISKCQIWSVFHFSGFITQKGNEEFLIEMSEIVSEEKTSYGLCLKQGNFDKRPPRGSCLNFIIISALLPTQTFLISRSTWFKYLFVFRKNVFRNRVFVVKVSLGLI